ncbi:hypothetical protein PV726_01605 [Streptomyces europaeiscabiei]|uniref:hypothetical protein n=1 Tax=Streptomyces europaeiscabiei TaxID=146819 RepID=UPI0029B206F7|nr:hypothetical protein [Streptomyces europaeiscabiei]MDX3689045.1 hypothetical protein [Streptomyces europaeiscabiei]
MPSTARAVPLTVHEARLTPGEAGPTHSGEPPTALAPPTHLAAQPSAHEARLTR